MKYKTKALWALILEKMTLSKPFPYLSVRRLLCQTSNLGAGCSRYRLLLAAALMTKQVSVVSTKLTGWTQVVEPGANLFTVYSHSKLQF